jgi:hypothetical protein
MVGLSDSNSCMRKRFLLGFTGVCNLMLTGRACGVVLRRGNGLAIVEVKMMSR